MKRLIIILMVCLIGIRLCAQEASGSGLDISGYTRATGYLGIYNHEAPTLKSLYSETSVKLKARAGQWGQAYTDVRLRTGNEYSADFTTVDVREAYLDVFLGTVNLRVGKQISPWGRADGWNPTDNLTPSNYFVRSPDPDDMRLGNYRIRGQYTPYDWLKIEADLAPWYVPSVYRFDQIDMPAFVTISEPEHPDFHWNKTTVAARLDLIFPAIEGSLSWFSGYDPLPLLRPGAIGIPPEQEFSVELLQTPFRQQTLGADVASAIGQTSIRGEFAYKIPYQGDTVDLLIPDPEWQWVISLDREFGPFRLIAGYMGKFVEDFQPADPPVAIDPDIIYNPLVLPYIHSAIESQIEYYNRILYDQTHEWSHSMIIRPSINLFHESLEVEVSTLYNFTTKEYMVYPKATYHIADGLQVVAGYQYYHGGAFTRFKWISEPFNGPFFEFRIIF